MTASPREESWAGGAIVSTIAGAKTGSTRVDGSAILGGRSGSDSRALKGARCNVLILGPEVRNRAMTVGS
jgi:hypothetical protein